ncbi:hypothetical protein BV898_18737 [Hypsibius exemplaris]|uniref:Secreted protein n=1 Tax=Hypsibius exemplaris TaxID=2072580 RepID=A0A9X6NJE6_HYPEX|nr:hypothetical protein BV898_18737 [Hypsibius exemplaris]
MEHLAIWSGILILLLYFSCLEGRSDLGGHSEGKQNIDGKDSRPFLRHSRAVAPSGGLRGGLCGTRLGCIRCICTPRPTVPSQTQMMTDGTHRMRPPGPRRQSKTFSFLIVSWMFPL